MKARPRRSSPYQAPEPEPERALALAPERALVPERAPGPERALVPERAPGPERALALALERIPAIR